MERPLIGIELDAAALKGDGLGMLWDRLTGGRIGPVVDCGIPTDNDAPAYIVAEDLLYPAIIHRFERVAQVWERKRVQRAQETQQP